MAEVRPILIGGGRTVRAYRNALERAEVQRDALSKEQAELVRDVEAARARIDELEAALRDLYHAAVQVVDITNPDLVRERRRLSRLLDKYERLASPGGK